MSASPPRLVSSSTNSKLVPKRGHVSQWAVRFQGGNMTEVKDVQLTVDGSTSKLEIERASVGNDGLSIGHLLRETGLVTVDPGFMNTASCESAITYIDGDAGILRYRGYPIEQLAKHSSFLEVAYLLIHGDLPSRSELDAFVERVNRHTLVHQDFRDFIATFPPAAHPMAVMSSAVSALPAFYPESLDPFDQHT